jgi:hypothetical protein
MESTGLSVGDEQCVIRLEMESPQAALLIRYRCRGLLLGDLQDSVQAIIEFDPVTHVQRPAAKKSRVLTVTFNGQGHYMCCKTWPNTCDTRHAC